MSALACLPEEPPDDDGSSSETSRHVGPRADEALCYSIELWDDKGERPEMTLAIARTAVIAYSTYFAAAKDFPHRIITLRHRGRILSRWSIQSH